MKVGDTYDMDPTDGLPSHYVYDGKHTAVVLAVETHPGDYETPAEPDHVWVVCTCGFHWDFDDTDLDWED